MKEYKFFLIDIEDHVALVTINNPKALNALSSPVVLEMIDVMQEISAMKDVRCVILTGAGEKSFVAGADIKEMFEMDPAQGKAYGILGSKAFQIIENMPQPVIAAVNGFALGGGCELAMACDIRICAENAMFGQPEVGLGITPGFGGTQRLSRIVGTGMAKELVFSARNIKAPEALRIGLVNAVYAPEELMEQAFKLAEKIASNAPIAVQAAKKAMNEGISLPIQEAVVCEEKAFGSCFATADQKEGMGAFLEKRKPTGFVNK